MNPIQTRAFELYFAMPSGVRSARTVGAHRQVRKSKKTILRWMQKFHWKELILKRQEEYGLRARQSTDADLMNQRKTLLNVYRALLAKCFQKVRGEDGVERSELIIEPKDVADVERITKYILLLSGDVTERSEYISIIIQKVFSVIDVEISDPAARYRVYQKLGGVFTDGASPQAHDGSAAGPGGGSQTPA